MLGYPSEGTGITCKTGQDCRAAKLFIFRRKPAGQLLLSMSQATVTDSHSPSLRLGDVPWGVGHLNYLSGNSITGQETDKQWADFMPKLPYLST
jgi:hypothetical protein